MTTETKVQRTKSGVVTSDKMNQTVTVMIERKIKHPLYGKYIKKSTKIHAHDPDNKCQQGDVVKIVECRPISKTKSWKVVEIVETNK
ncbi:30S ribosomal protein S17 [Marinicella sp. S1101]|uniref:30S ribosomal protein S17 n=1 Tax=Marinicella marina TaxID=2996016 RepID=UPI002260DFCC|nr:30S ribosomal protein S17 [Marinicella marina]MCX7555097.1 30S ribosomal protein S17 [Marinicella marina]MDJ1140306.1 30S ribosomal protein S17 [Marinicella marina]